MSLVLTAAGLATTPRGRTMRLAEYPGSYNGEDGWVMGIQDWCDLPQIHPSKIRVGDIIGTMKPSKSRLTVKMISGPQTSPRRWTFFGRDDIGRQHTSTFGEDELVRKYS